MRKLIFLILLISITLAWSQVEWDTDGIPVRQGVNIEWFRSAISLTDGGCVYTWSDTRLGDRDIFAQRIDGSGNLLWGEDGAMINGEIDRQEDIVVINGSGNETIFAWVEFRHEDAGDVYAQKLDGDGNVMWATEGISLCLTEGIQISLNIVSDEQGGAYIIWLDDRNPGGSDIYGTHIESDGSIADGWDEGGNPIIQMGGSQSQHTFWEDGEGGAIVVWYDQRDPDNHNLYMQRISADGTLLWGENGNLLCDAADIQNSGKIAPDGTGNFIVSWRDRRNDTDGDIYANRIDLDGNVLWAEDLVVYEGFGIQRNPRVTKASDEGVFVTWEDGRNSSNFKDIFVQKISTAGEIIWSSAGEIVSDELNDQLNPRLVGDDNGGCWIIWDDGRDGNHPNEDIYMQHYNSSGTQLLGEDGYVICDAEGFQFSPLIKKDGNGQLFLSWGDNRNGSTGLYYQLIDENGTGIMEDNGELIYYGLCGDALNFQMFSTGEKQVLFWEDTRFSSIAKQLYMQVMDHDGGFELIEDGIPVTNMSYHDQINFDAVINGDNIAIAWVEQRELKKKIYAQLVDTEGTHYWGDDELGVQLSYRNSEQGGVRSSTEDGAYYFGWSDRVGFIGDVVNQVCAQKVVDGVVQWGDEAVSVADLDDDDVLTDVVGRYFIWQNEYFTDYNLYVNLLTEDGEIATGWDEDGIMICGAPYNQKNAQGLMTDEGLLVIWEDQRNGVDSDIYGQIITEDGQTQWADDGLALVSQQFDQSGAQAEYYDGYLYLIWEDLRDSTDFDIYMQKYNLAGDAQWAEGGIGVAVKPYEQANPAFSFYGETINVYWDDVTDENGKDIFMQKYNLEGRQTTLIPTGGENICSAIKNQGQPAAVTGNDGYSYVIWSDFRSSGKTDIYNIYAQKVDTEIVALNPNQIDDQVMINMNNYPNPFQKGTILSFAVGREQLIDAKVKIYNTRGQRVITLPLEDNRVYWDGNDEGGRLTASGVYMYRLESKYFESQTTKMIRVK